MTDSTLTLSEALLVGASQYKWIKWRMFDFDADGKVCAACALGDAYIGRFGAPSRDTAQMDCVGALNEAYPVMRQTATCPLNEYHVEVRLVGQLIPHLNDSHGYTPQQIAEWVATIEAGTP